MALKGYNEFEFRRTLDRALEKVKTVLENTKFPQHAANVPHTYNDKYLLAEFLTNTFIAATLNVLETIGLNVEGVRKLVEWSKAQGRSVSLRFSMEERTVFEKETTREEEDPTSYVTERKGGILGSAKITEKVMRKITEYFWKFSFEYEISAFVGSDPNEKVVLFRRAGTNEIKTLSKMNPRKEVKVYSPIDTNISWLFARVVSGGVMGFSINRMAKSCHTPRRNDDIEEGLRFCRNMWNWLRGVQVYFERDLFPAQVEHSLDLSAINSDGVFVPVLPFFEDVEKSDNGKSLMGLLEQNKGESESEGKGDVLLVVKEEGNSRVLPLSYINPFLAEQLRSLNEKIGVMGKVFPADEKVITSNEGRIVIATLHGRDVCQAYINGVDYIEDMLRSQLIAAIGKIVTPEDFGNYMRFHYRKLYLNEYAPQLFCYAVRRPDHYPEGTLSIEEAGGSDTSDPIQTVVCARPAHKLMYLPINAATKVGFGGDRYLHAWVSHQFSGHSSTSLSLVARARQFSSFILVVGRIGGPSLFEPKHAIIIQNKDELKIPLLLEQIPTPKEFRDAIESLSPEQQRFAKAFRSMQLESTLFGVCVIQIKPQLEKLLGLPDDSLTKEIKLTQDLLSLFIDYQIPSDLLSFDGRRERSVDEKIRRVKELVKEMKDMIQRSKDEELAEAKRQQEMRLRLEMEERMRREEEERRRREDEERRRREEEVRRVREDMENLRECLEDRGMVLCEQSAIMCAPQSKKSPSFFSFLSSAVSSSSAVSGSSASAPRSASIAPPTRFVATPSSNALPPPRPSPSLAAPPPSLSVSSSAPPPPPSASVQSPPPPPPSVQPAPSSQPSPSPSSPSSSESVVVEQPRETVKECEKGESGEVKGEEEDIDYTKIPTALDAKYEALDEDSALRPTIINIGPCWSKKYQQSLLSSPSETSLEVNEHTKERNKAFDLLDALSRSGSLPIDQATLHIVIASTHCFDKSLVDTIIQDNVNPIEKVERSSLIVATTIHNRPVEDLLRPEQHARVLEFSPILFAK